VELYIGGIGIPDWTDPGGGFSTAVITPIGQPPSAPVTLPPPVIVPPNPASNSWTPPPISTRIGVVETPPVSVSPSVNDLLAAPASAGAASEHITVGSLTMASLPLTQSASLEGGVNSPAITPDPNSPGLASNSILRGITVSKKWMWIILIVVALLGLWYFYGSSLTA